MARRRNVRYTLLATETNIYIYMCRYEPRRAEYMRHMALKIRPLYNLAS